MDSFLLMLVIGLGVLVSCENTKLKERLEGIDNYHVSRVNAANRRIEELEDKIRDLEFEVNWK